MSILEKVTRVSRIHYKVITGKWFIGIARSCARYIPGSGVIKRDIDESLDISFELNPREWIFGLQKDWYDGPLYQFGLGPIIFTSCYWFN